jgi:hypothetical protein
VVVGVGALIYMFMPTKSGSVASGSAEAGAVAQNQPAGACSNCAPARSEVPIVVKLELSPALEAKLDAVATSNVRQDAATVVVYRESNSCSGTVVSQPCCGNTNLNWGFSPVRLNFPGVETYYPNQLSVTDCGCGCRQTPHHFSPCAQPRGCGVRRCVEPNAVNITFEP